MFSESAVAIAINTTTLNERKLKTCISQRSKLLTNYNMGELSCYFGFKYLVPLSDCQQIVQTFDRRKDYNGVKIDGKICFKEVLIPLLECIN